MMSCSLAPRSSLSAPQSSCGMGPNFAAESIAHHGHKAVSFDMLRLADAIQSMEPQK